MELVIVLLERKSGGWKNSEGWAGDLVVVRKEREWLISGLQIMMKSHTLLHDIVLSFSYLDLTIDRPNAFMGHSRSLDIPLAPCFPARIFPPQNLGYGQLA